MMNKHTSTTVDAAVRFAENIAVVQYEDIPPEAVAITKRGILDILSVGVAGTSAEGCEKLVDLARDLGGQGESSILCHDVKVPSLYAAMVNATMARARDYMDEHCEASLCCAVTLVPVAFAIAEKKGKVDGKSFITALTLGLDMIIRMGLAWKGSYRGWSGQSVFGYFGSAAVTGKLLGLDKGQLLDAFGIAYAQASGNHQSSHEGALTKRLSTGLAARGGIFSALLAEKGYFGGRDSLEGYWGLYNLYRDGDYDSTCLTDQLGKRFEVVGLGFKAYPCCAQTHTSVSAVLTLASQHHLLPERVKMIKVGVNADAFTNLVEPIEIKRVPRTTVGAQFSLPYTVATAILDQKVTIDSFSEEAIKRPQIIGLAEKIEPYVDAEIENAFSGQISPAKVEVTTLDGSVYSMRVNDPPGHPRNPMSEEDINRKIWECMKYAKKPIPKENVQKVIALVNALEQVDDVGQIMRLLG
jgi:2-methylcitrate dehydratase PrpD